MENNNVIRSNNNFGAYINAAILDAGGHINKLHTLNNGVCKPLIGSGVRENSKVLNAYNTASGKYFNFTENAILNLKGESLKIRLFARIVSGAIDDATITVPEEIKNLDKNSVQYKKYLKHNSYYRKRAKLKFDAEYFLDNTLRNWCEILQINYGWLRKIIIYEIKNKISLP